MFTLPKLSYDYYAIEPFIDAKTMEIHHTKHHQAYIDNLNKALEGSPLASASLEQILSTVSQQTPAVRNNGGGHWNHSFFWELLAPPAQAGKPSADLSAAIATHFGSLDGLKEKFIQTGMTRFGSGWAWLIVQEGKLVLSSTPNQDNPLMDVAEQKGFPILGVDVWEHAYYLHYQNRRMDYLKAFWEVISWNQVNAVYTQCVGK